MRILVAALLFCISVHAQDWQPHFANIPIRTKSFRAHLTPPVELILTNFQPSAELRAVVFMPGAADRLYFYDWGEVTLPENPTLLDAITALTNAADLRVFVAPPFLLKAPRASVGLVRDRCGWQHEKCLPVLIGIRYAGPKAAAENRVTARGGWRQPLPALPKK